MLALDLCFDKRISDGTRLNQIDGSIKQIGKRVTQAEIFVQSASRWHISKLDQEIGVA